MQEGIIINIIIIINKRPSPSLSWSSFSSSNSSSSSPPALPSSSSRLSLSLSKEFGCLWKDKKGSGIIIFIIFIIVIIIIVIVTVQGVWMFVERQERLWQRNLGPPLNILGPCHPTDEDGLSLSDFLDIARYLTFFFKKNPLIILVNCHQTNEDGLYLSGFLVFFSVINPIARLSDKKAHSFL